MSRSGRGHSEQQKDPTTVCFYKGGGDVNVMEIMEAFSEAGKIVELNVGTYKVFVKYKTAEEARLATQMYKDQGVHFDGDKSKARRRPHIQRRGKYSAQQEKQWLDQLVPNGSLCYTVGFRRPQNDQAYSEILEHITSIAEVVELTVHQNSVFVRFLTREEAMSVLKTYANEFSLFVPEEKVGKKLLQSNGDLGVKIRTRLDLEENLIPDRIGHYAVCFHKTKDAMSQEAIKSDFSVAGEVKGIDISNNFVFVRFANKRAVIKAMDLLQKAYNLEIPRNNLKTHDKDSIHAQHKLGRGGRDHSVEEVNKSAQEVFVARLPRDATDRMVREELEVLGIPTVREVRCRTNKRGCRFAFLVYSTAEQAQNAAEALNGHIMGGDHLIAHINNKERDKRGPKDNMARNAERRCSESDSSSTIPSLIDDVNEVPDDETTQVLRSGPDGDGLQNKGGRQQVSHEHYIADEESLHSISNQVAQAHISDLLAEQESEVHPSSYVNFDELLNAHQPLSSVKGAKLPGAAFVKSEGSAMDTKFLVKEGRPNSVSASVQKLHGDEHSMGNCDDSDKKYNVIFTGRALNGLLKFNSTAKDEKYRLKSLEGPEHARMVITTMLYQEPWKSKVAQHGLSNMVFFLTVDKIQAVVWYDPSDDVSQVLKVSPL